MSLRGKTILILCATTLLATALVAVVWFSFFIRRVSAMEDEELEAANRRVASLIEDDIEQLDLLTADWSFWDDSYLYAVTADPLYESSTFASDRTFSSLGLSGFAFIGASGRILYSYVSDELVSGREVAAIARGLSGYASARGLVVLGNGVHLAAARPVLRSDGSGEPRGAIVMTRPLDAARLARYVRLMGVRVSLSTLPPEVSGGDEVSVRHSATGIRATAPLRDIAGKAIAALVVEEGESPYRRSPAIVLLFATIVLVGGGIGFSSLRLLETGVFRRIRELKAGLGGISSGRDPEARLSVSGCDEFTELESVMNRTLDSLGTVIQQRDATLREVHHRVKNNLQVIASLLSLQAGEVQGSEAVEALYDVRRRVLSMALVHDELYIDPDLSSVSADRFLERLARAVEPRIVLAAPIEVAIDGAGGDGPLSIDAWRAIPVGIIVSEAISASCNRTSHGSGIGRVSLTARPLGEDGFLIEMRDDYTGPAEDDGTAAESFGLRLARLLAEQIGGTVEVHRSAEGGLFALRVPGSDRR